jgi:hypothetical protein
MGWFRGGRTGICQFFPWDNLQGIDFTVLLSVDKIDNMVSSSASAGHLKIRPCGYLFDNGLVRRTSGGWSLAAVN